MEADSLFLNNLRQASANPSDKISSLLHMTSTSLEFSSKVSHLGLLETSYTAGILHSSSSTIFFVTHLEVLEALLGSPIRIDFKP